MSGILCDWEIEELVKVGMIRDFDPSHLNSFGYDLTLATEFLLLDWDYSSISIIDPNNMSEVRVKEYEGNYCLIPPNSFILGKSVEYLTMPDTVIGICLGRSTYARCGIITNTTPLEAGWSGTVTIEISNSTPHPAKVYAHKGIVQVLFLKGEKPRRNYVEKGGKYQGQVRVTLPRGV